MPSEITITPSVEVGVPHAGQTGFSLRLDASASNFGTSAIFRFRQFPLEPGQTVYDAEVSGVCSPSDLEEFPATAPLPDADPAWFRLPYVVGIFRSTSELVETQTAIYEEIDTLLATLDRNAVLEAQTPVVFPR